jgi:4-carboxymuconolactone decarboxylase
MIRLLTACVVASTLVALAAAQSAQAPASRPNPRDIRLRGDRFRPLTYEEMTPAQKTMLEHLVASPRGGADGPFNVLLRSPEMGDLAQQFGAARFTTPVPRRLWELAILLTARHWTSQFEWYAHRRGAIQAGVSATICDAIAEGRRPAGMQPDETAVYDFASELLETKQVSDATFNAARDLLGERGLVDLIGVMGWYGTVSMLLNVDRYPLPDGVQPPLKALK